jgi:hypothetical protein
MIVGRLTLCPRLWAVGSKSITSVRDSRKAVHDRDLQRGLAFILLLLHHAASDFVRGDEGTKLVLRGDGRTRIHGVRAERPTREQRWR